MIGAAIFVALSVWMLWHGADAVVDPRNQTTATLRIGRFAFFAMTVVGATSALLAAYDFAAS